jgi:Ni,Fe-hydrogenase III large subunit
VSAVRSAPTSRIGTQEIARVAPADWRAACLSARDAGEDFAGLFAAEHDGTVALRAVFTSPRGERVIACAPADGEVATLVDEIPAAAWPEREAHDTCGLRFAGHEPLRPLVDHDAPLPAWTVPTVGEDVHQVAVGPIHAGVIESGHFRFHVVGERILHLDARLFYKRRGLEAAARGRPLAEAIAYAQRACAACAVTNSVAYAHACESALGLVPDEPLRRERTLLLELERAYNHLHDLSATCAGVGFAAGTMAYATLKERLQHVNQRVTGHRFLFDSIRLGTGTIALKDASLSQARRALSAVCAEHETTWRELQFAISLQERLGGVGVLTREAAERHGAVGPAARASGLRRDTRSASPRLCYAGFHPVALSEPTGDVAARMTQRALELKQSFAILDELLEHPLQPGGTRADHDATALGVGHVEGPRGATVCLVETSEHGLGALHLRTASYANWPALTEAAAGNLLPDFPLVNKSFELCYACVDR